MNRRRSLTSVALTLASFGIAAAINGCSGAPTETTEGASSALYAPVGTGVIKESPPCAPFTYPSRKCLEFNGSVECGPLSCWDVTYLPVPATATDGFVFTSSTPIPPDPALTNLGCTWGVSLAGVDHGGVSAPYTANFWACPVNATIPTQFTALSECNPNFPSALPCEFDSVGTGIDGNAAVGAPMLGWKLVEEGVETQFLGESGDTDAGNIVHSCGGGCANVLQ